MTDELLAYLVVRLRRRVKREKQKTKAFNFDKTGLSGTYNYTLQFGREWSSHDPDSWPSIFTVVQEQLGLKLESVHEPVPNLVVDHITKPTEN